MPTAARAHRRLTSAIVVIASSLTVAMAKTAIVTGANKGIGFHIAEQLVAAKHDVIIACRDRQRGEEAAKKLGCQSAVLDISSPASIDQFAQQMAREHERIDVLVNNAAIAFKGADPTPFAQQTRPTLATNFEGTVGVTEALLPLLRKAPSARIVNIASMAGVLRQLAPERQRQFSDPGLTLPTLRSLVGEFEADVQKGNHGAAGWGNSNYGFSKLAVIAYTNVVAKQEGDKMRVNSCCPGYCDTDMTSHKGPRPPAEGARTATKLAMLPDDGPTGTFWQDEKQSVW